MCLQTPCMLALHGCVKGARRAVGRKAADALCSRAKLPTRSGGRFAGDLRHVTCAWPRIAQRMGSAPHCLGRLVLQSAANAADARASRIRCLAVPWKGACRSRLRLGGQKHTCTARWPKRKNTRVHGLPIGSTDSLRTGVNLGPCAACVKLYVSALCPITRVCLGAQRLHSTVSPSHCASTSSAAAIMPLSDMSFACPRPSQLLPCRT